ncbi:hypothetical protein NEILACOT_04621 [Neisseria lactamica ATCC 23970]|uniref:Uncharacterized protein n=1 Tax=Neisseria lactamica ATCC 23970 TaxID=546265 RepID=D0WAQ0_NEILA|nr:hypothetical protein NEILACOT_04621 [Neisseria lactamica ATCC 23970]
MDNRGIGGTAAVVSEVTGSLTIQVLFDRLPITWSNFNSGKRSICLAIMAWAVCRKKVLMENPLNVLVGFLGGFLGEFLQRSQAA